MTVIAWDGKTLAADKRLTDSGGLARTVTKIYKRGGTLIGATGDASVSWEMLNWYKVGADIGKFPESAKADSATLIVITKSGVSIYTTSAHPVMLECEKCAFGSGRDYAQAVMHLGFDSVRAVEVACLFQIDCGNGIDVFEL